MQQYGGWISFFCVQLGCGTRARSCYLRKTLRRARCGGAYLVCSSVCRPNCRWGVVQPVGHHTVNVDGEGSNPSAPAKFSAEEYSHSSPLERHWSANSGVGA